MLHKLDGWCFTSFLFFLAVADGFHRTKAFGGDFYGYRPLLTTVQYPSTQHVVMLVSKLQQTSMLGI